jgi:hypothetical protein
MACVSAPRTACAKGEVIVRAQIRGMVSEIAALRRRPIPGSTQKDN